MHTVVVIVQGFVLLALCLLVARLVSGDDAGNGGSDRPMRMHLACRVFIVLWLVCSLANLWRGVMDAGYSLMHELPHFLIVFAVPAMVAVWIGRRALRRALP